MITLTYILWFDERGIIRPALPWLDTPEHWMQYNFDTLEEAQAYIRERFEAQKKALKEYQPLMDSQRKLPSSDFGFELLSKEQKMYDVYWYEHYEETGSVISATRYYDEQQKKKLLASMSA